MSRESGVGIGPSGEYQPSVDRTREAVNWLSGTHVFDLGSGMV